MNNKYWNVFTDKFGNTIFHPQYFIHKYLRESQKLILEKAKGKDMIDIGCGRMQNKNKYLEVVNSYTGLDHPKISKLYENENNKPEIYHDLNKKINTKTKYDIAIMSEVLEYLVDPIFSLKEITKILKKDSSIILTVPFLYPIHDFPLDRARYTETQLQYFLNKSGYKNVEVKPLGNAFEITAILINIYCFKKAQSLFQSNMFALKIFSLFLIWLSLLISVINNIIASLLSFILPEEKIFVLSYLITAQKK